MPKEVRRENGIIANEITPQEIGMARVVKERVSPTKHLSEYQ
jgi:hypothetical protein